MARFNPSQPTPPILRINRFRGLNVSVDPTQLAYNESPDLLNMQLDTEGAINKRTGYYRAFPDSLGPGKIHSLHEYLGRKILHHGTKLYTFELGEPPEEIYDGMADAKSRYFVMNGLLYIMDGTHYLEYDGTTVKTVEPYIPTLFISTPPTGGGTPLEQFNLIGTAFEQSFSGDGTAKVYPLALGVLDATPVVASIDGGITWDQAETTHFTVDRTLGKVTWITAPPNVPNNVKIRAHKTVPGMADKIKKCTGHKIYGGTNDTRVFMWGSDNNTLYRSDIYRPSYFPENQNQQIGSTAEKIMGMSIQYDTAIIEKEHTKWGMTFHDDGQRVTFPVRPINDQVGCFAAGSVQVVENNPVSLTKQGLYWLVGGTVRDERNVSHQSRRADRLLLNEPNLKDAISVEYGKKYLLALNNKVYVWDYLQPMQDTTQVGEWYLWDNIPAACFLESGRDLYFGSNEEGMVYLFFQSDEPDAYNDDGVAINAYWRSKIEGFGATERYKTVPRVFFSIKPAIKTSADLFYVDETNIPVLLGTSNMTYFTYQYYDYARFSYLTSSYPQVTRIKVKAKKIIYFQILIQNDRHNESLGILTIEVEHKYNNYVK